MFTILNLRGNSHTPTTQRIDPVQTSRSTRCNDGPQWIIAVVVRILINVIVL
jgi:hypothetical protein